MSKRPILQVIAFKHLDRENEFVTKAHYLTLENAIKDAEKWIEVKASTLNREVVSVEIYDKMTHDKLWEYDANK